MTIRGTRVEITGQLSREVTHLFANWIGCYNVVWNCKVAENKNAYRDYLESISSGLPVAKPTFTQAYAHHITPERFYLKDIPSQIRRNAAVKCHEACNAGIKQIRNMPRFKKANAKRNCLVTNELFDITLHDNTIEFAFKKTNKSDPFCHLVLPRKQEMIDIPKVVWITREQDRYFLSYSYTKESLNNRDEKTILEYLKQAPEAYQQEAVMGIDLGVAQPIVLSTGQILDFTKEEKKSLEKKNAARVKYQKRLARQQRMAKQSKKKMGQNAKKTKTKLADVSAGMAHIRKHMAHRISKTIAQQAVEVVVCEDLKILNLTKSPQPKQNVETGKYLPNGARAKAGLNKSILNVGWGRILKFTEYKLCDRDKLLVSVDSRYSSQECHECGHIDASNRLTRAAFCCTKCNHQDDADHNAALILKKRFLTQLNTNTFVTSTKAVKKIAVRRQKAAQTADSVCGANIGPRGSGVEAETSKSNLENHLFVDVILEGILEAQAL